MTLIQSHLNPHILRCDGSSRTNTVAQACGYGCERRCTIERRMAKVTKAVHLMVVSSDFCQGATSPLLCIPLAVIPFGSYRNRWEWPEIRGRACFLILFRGV